MIPLLLIGGLGALAVFSIWRERQGDRRRHEGGDGGSWGDDGGSDSGGADGGSDRSCDQGARGIVPAPEPDSASPAKAGAQLR